MLSVGGPHLVQEVATRAVKQSSVVRENENGEEEEEEAEFGEEDLFHQQVVTLCPPAAWAEHLGTRMRALTCLLGCRARIPPSLGVQPPRQGWGGLLASFPLCKFCDIRAAGCGVPKTWGVSLPLAQVPLACRMPGTRVAAKFSARVAQGSGGIEGSRNRDRYHTPLLGSPSQARLPGWAS